LTYRFAAPFRDREKLVTSHFLQNASQKEIFTPEPFN